MLLDKLKLSKPLVRAMTDEGYLNPTAVQERTMSRMLGGQDVITVAPEGSGKTTAYILAVLMRLKYGVEEAPRALILVPDKERVLDVLERFERLNRNKTIRTVGLYSDTGMEGQMNALADGADIVVATPDRARAIYLKLGLNLNKIIMFIVDDAADMISKGLQLPVSELARSIVKCQHLVFTEVLHDKLINLIDPFMNQPATIEVSELSDSQMKTIEQVLYKTPDFTSKLDLLNFLLKDSEVFDKVLVFVNTRLTAEKVYKNSFRYLDKAIAIYKPLFFDHPGFDSIEDFNLSKDTRILLVADELREDYNLEGISFLIHLEVPVEKETFLARVVARNDASEQIGITFSTDHELAMIKKIEQSIGKIIPIADLPEGFVVNKIASKEKKRGHQEEAAPSGAAFHEKKDKNNKDYNYSSREKAKMKFKNR